jgi:hypothetical protein
VRLKCNIFYVILCWCVNTLCHSLTFVQSHKYIIV